MSYPNFVCQRDGLKAASRSSTRVIDNPTYQSGKCDVCGKPAQVTSPRSFGYPKFDRK